VDTKSAGKAFHAQALEVLGALQATRNLMRGHRTADQDMIEFAVPHSLAFAFFPHWLMELRHATPQAEAMKTRLIAMNVHDAVLRLAEGGCDLLIAHHHPALPLPLQLNAERYEMLAPGEESLRAYAKAGPDVEPLLRLPPLGRGTVPFLSYSSGTYLGQMVDLIIKQASRPGEPTLSLEPIYETDMAEGLKAIALEGHGLAFLPASSVRKETKARKLVTAAPSGSFELSMEVRIYRERPAVARHAKPAVQALWDHLQPRSPPWS